LSSQLHSTFHSFPLLYFLGSIAEDGVRCQAPADPPFIGSRNLINYLLRLSITMFFAWAIKLGQHGGRWLGGLSTRKQSSPTTLPILNLLLLTPHYCSQLKLLNPTPAPAFSSQLLFTFYFLPQPPLKDGNFCPKPETRWVITLLGQEYG
jgi:hypothetical protein